MRSRCILQARFDHAFDNYLGLTDLLRADLQGLLIEESKAPHWRRNFVRSAAAMLEGHAHCLRQMCRVAIAAGAPPVSMKQRRVIDDERAVDTISRMKYTLSAAYTLFDLAPRPEFTSESWLRAAGALRKRHVLMHPKNARQLGITDGPWRKHKNGLVWLMKQYFDFLELSQKKYRS